ncbi:MAG TPA: outer membrane beta-barrel protein, partial [Bacillota bacterium]|nr:outer membrane beta-barrel protein [Bacillota bacterium]
FESINNPNFTRSYGYTIEPISHTGLQVAYQFSDAVSAIVGVVDTFGPKINERAFPTRAESYKAYMGSVTFTAPTNWGILGGATLTGCIMNGFNSASPSVGAAADQTTYYVGTTLNTPISGLKIGAAYDYAGVSEQAVTANRSGYANAVGLYALYQATEKLSFNARGEYASTSVPATLLATKIFETTATVQYELWKNVVSRLEFRWDHAADGSNPFGGVASTDPGTKKNSYILIGQVAYKF